MNKLCATTLSVAALLLCLLTCGPSPETETPAEVLTNGDFTANLNGFNIFYSVHGRGPVLMVMPNSWGLSHEGLRSLFKVLEDYLTLVYFDPRGIGRSDDIRAEEDMSAAAIREDLNALVQHLGLNRIHLIGWSNGGENLLFFAAEHPELVDRAIALHTVPYFSEEDIKDLRQRFPEAMAAYGTFMQEMAGMEASDEEKTARYKEFTINEYFPWMFAEREGAAERLEDLFGDAEFSWRHYQYANTVDGANFDARPMLSKITATTLIIAGAKDMLPQPKVQETAYGINNSSYVLFRQSGHFSPIEEPDRFVAVVRQFLGVDKQW